ncbi:MAG: bifunctional demethylmenaquinone methyltransferase/2-methoxy-6-polyprenyl-1,4-benzoquinol methylase UbiE [Deltaproteobacteria bacterium]|nr:bifunctional demethylmenaquinone methyltransferase/2-methoxy-6-polyprenyl-1,4-benzoquinol methylase UbiE [Deltaproteobacteria bacterium]
MTNNKPLTSAPEKKEGALQPSTGEAETAQFGYRKVPVKEKANWVRNHFDTVAQKYDLMNTLLSFGIHYLWKRTAIKWLGLKPGDRVLDVCGGTGDLSILALKKVRPGKVILYDINRAMMEMGRRKSTNAAARKEISFIQGDAEQMAIKSESFDAAMVGFGIRNLTHMEEGFKEMHRVLKPGGRLMCLEFSKPTWPWFRWLYDFYSFRIMPLIGLFFVGSRQAYTYLPESIRLFPSPAELTRRLEEIGFYQVAYRTLTNGIAVVHVGTKK